MSPQQSRRKKKIILTKLFTFLLKTYFIFKSRLSDVFELKAVAATSNSNFPLYLEASYFLLQKRFSEKIR